jgi:uncharacterized membrane protein
MNKKEFIEELRLRLSGLPKDDLENRLSFYEESINDRMDDGKTEEEAIKELGTIEEIVTQVAGETSLVTLVKEKARPKRKLSGAEIALIAIGFPLWFPLLLTALILCLVFCLVFWIIGLIPLITCISSFLVGIAEFFSYFSIIGTEGSLGVLGMGLAGLGLALMLIPAVIYAVKGTIKLVKVIMIGIKKLFIRRRK